MEPLYELIRRFEGCHLEAYLCPAKVWTIGYGATGAGIGPGVKWTQEQAESRLRADVDRFVKGTLECCPNLRGNALCAIADFAYNCGLANLRGSTLRRVINEGDYTEAQKQLRRWVRAGGKVLRGLVLRREAEAELLVLGAE